MHTVIKWMFSKWKCGILSVWILFFNYSKEYWFGKISVLLKISNFPLCCGLYIFFRVCIHMWLYLPRLQNLIVVSPPTVSLYRTVDLDVEEGYEYGGSTPPEE